MSVEVWPQVKKIVCFPQAVPAMPATNAKCPSSLLPRSGYACRGGGCHWHSCGLGSSLKPHPWNNSTGVQVREDKYPEVWRAPGSSNQKAAIERYKVHPPQGRKRYMQRGGE